MTEELPPGGDPRYVGDISNDMSDTHNSIFHTAVETTRMPMIVTNPHMFDNPIVFANDAFLTMTGYSAEELVGKNCRILQGPDSDPETIKEISRAIANREKVDVEILNYKKTGETFWNALFICPIFDNEGQINYFFASQLDVSRRHELVEALQHSRRMEAVGQLTGGIAHDFNNLLSVMQGFSEIIKNEISKDIINKAKIDRAVSAILQATNKGASLTTQLLSFARKQKLEGKITTLKDLVDQIGSLMERTVGDNIHVEVIHGDNLCQIKIDSSQAGMAILNIAKNARDAMGESGTLTISTRHFELEGSSALFPGVAGKYECLTIEDSGIGIDPDILDKITEPFFTTKEEGKGTGLGLSMVYGFMKQSGGFLKIESKLGMGTQVHMLFPSFNAVVEKLNHNPESVSGNSVGGGETILLVEDRADLADLTTQILSSLGYKVITRTNADDALEVINDQEIDLLFSDVVMPGINGIDLARIARKINPELKILMTTGYTDSSVEFTDNRGNTLPVIRKPYKQEVLAVSIRGILDEKPLMMSFSS